MRSTKILYLIYYFLPPGRTEVRGAAFRAARPPPFLAPRQALVGLGLVPNDLDPTNKIQNMPLRPLPAGPKLQVHAS